MKHIKTLFLFAFLLFTVNNLSQNFENKQNYLFFSERVKQINNSNLISNNISSGKSILKLTEKNLINGSTLIQECCQTYEFNEWINDWQISYTYDLDNNLLEMTEEDWLDDHWINYQKKTYAYDSNNNCLEEFWQMWNGSEFFNSSKTTWTYDQNNNLLEEILQIWEEKSWMNESKSVFQYDQENNLTQKIEYIWEIGNWEGFDKETYSYYNNQIVEKIDYEWIGTEWRAEKRITFSYISMIYLYQELTQIWNGSDWIDEEVYPSE